MLLLLLFGSCKSSRNSVKVKPDNREAAVVPVPHKLSSSSVDTEMGRRLVSEARKWLGVPYSYGGNSRKGVDCSGLVVAVYRDAASLKLPRSSADQHRYCRDISRKDLEAGDLVFFKGSSKGKVSHVGIYIGDNKMIHASSSRGVIVSDLAEKYYISHYHASGRVEEKIVIPADGGNEIAVAPEIKEETGRRREVIEMTLDEFVARENRRQAIADSVAAARRDSIETARQDSIAAASAPLDSVVNPTVPPAVKEKQPRRKPSRQAAPADSIAVDTTAVSDDIRERVSRGFKGAF